MTIQEEGHATQLSRLERLPAEILRMTLFDSYEINLPLASPVIGRALSDIVVYKWFIRYAFTAPFPYDFDPLSRSNTNSLTCTYPSWRNFRRQSWRVTGSHCSSASASRISSPIACVISSTNFASVLKMPRNCRTWILTPRHKNGNASMKTTPTWFVEWAGLMNPAIVRLASGSTQAHGGWILPAKR